VLVSAKTFKDNIAEIAQKGNFLDRWELFSLFGLRLPFFAALLPGRSIASIQWDYIAHGLPPSNEAIASVPINLILKFKNKNSYPSQLARLANDVCKKLHEDQFLGKSRVHKFDVTEHLSQKSYSEDDLRKLYDVLGGLELNDRVEFIRDNSAIFPPSTE
jgi:hypothetical protein